MRSPLPNAVGGGFCARGGIFARPPPLVIVENLLFGLRIRQPRLSFEGKSPSLPEKTEGPIMETNFERKKHLTKTIGPFLGRWWGFWKLLPCGPHAGVRLQGFE